MSYTTIPFYSPEESLRLIMGKWKLTGQNYPVWKLHFDNVLRGQDKLYVINKPLSRPKSNAPEEEFAEYFRFMADESDVMSILSFSASPEFTVDLRVKFCHEVVKGIENQIGFYKNCGKYLIMKEIFSLKLKRGQSVKDHLLEIRRLFKCLSRLGYKMTQEELVYLMWFSLPKEIRVTASGYMGEPRMDVAKVHEDILDSLEPKEASADLMDSTDWIDELGYYFYNPSENKVFVARNGEFLEEKFLSQENTRNDIDLQVVEEETPEPIVEPVTQQGNVETQPETVEEVQTQDLRRSTRIRQEPDRYLGFLVSQDGGDLNEPTSYGEAVSGNESEQWQEAMKAEMQSMYDNQVWELTDLPQHCRAVGRKWVFKKKTDTDGNVHTFKARLVAKGFTQTHGIDYDETFSPVAMLKSIRILIAISAYFDYEIWQMDVKTAFLNGKLTEDVYMQQPEGFVDPKNPNKVCKLLKSIYGLKQASRSWNLHFDERIKEFGFAKSEFEPCVYTKFSGSIVTFLVLYVDDILLIGNDIPTLQSVKAWLSKCFQMKDLGEAAYILGIKIYRNRSRRLIGLSQGTYIDKVLKRFRMDESKKGFIPMQHGIVLSKAQCPESSQDKDKMKSIPYASAIGSIMYAMLCTRPDVAYSVSVTSRYQQNPGEAHWVAVKNILKYLRRTKEMFLVFGGSEDEISVTGYSDASFQTDRDDYRSQSGYVFTLNGGAISWKSSKQDTIADSTTEAEYIAASDAAKEAVWLRNFIKDLRVVASISRPVDIYCDNSGAVAQAKEPREHHKVETCTSEVSPHPRDHRKRRR
ncbi:hypothetical protein OSB04_un000174 [Centaurea solstitialis]|uniref:Reverse transcriptase Ty1/copia-type domain-containing protein n=1 Tax=Centaurea solstitialis TaxID=347529 RepID=A0AA38S5K4_9ASTR|nr:hypothetical protein OSB04_un000174 [Centaurea solstitialis]